MDTDKCVVDVHLHGTPRPQACSNPKDVLTVQLHDDCDQCEANQVNLLATPFSRMANIDVGRVKIQYREVSTMNDVRQQQG